ncbi:fimbria/pilus outer membrane usher protein [Pseudomonas sp. URMO17WK12:I12]|jgi:outer membrane usher protein|uniref:fimbria/pilus outer membrane usher protein n=1 Tax=Pseudomonas sp. URMO17WK12:I12 TaxID=1259797 RepID=UPI000519D092|nr:fimbria/pilus outer membrane usher protein [Pseudomonas sp. URMO17WK12:I12]
MGLVRLGLVSVAGGTALLIMVGVGPVRAEEYFDPAMLNSGGGAPAVTDLSVFQGQAGQLPGIYRVDVYVNGKAVDKRDIRFEPTEGQVLQPCLSLEMLDKWGVDLSLIQGVGQLSKCLSIDAVPQATTEFVFASQRLNVSVPQASMVKQARGSVSPSLWDQGENAAFLNYGFSGLNSSSRKGGGNSSSQSLSLLPGVNIGGWRIRNFTSVNKSSSSADMQIESVYNYAKRVFPSIGSELTVGAATTSSEVFDSVPFMGFQLGTDEDMLPESQRGYAPIVRGIARTAALVTVRQNGYVVYKDSVSPGPFEISDLYATGGNGDLMVTVEESDGTQQEFIVPFSSLAIMRREGAFSYSVAAGDYRPSSDDVEKRKVVQATAIKGLAHGTTVYGGFQAADVYHSVAAGLGLNMGDWGAVSADITQAWSQAFNEEKTGGQSARIRYNKNFVDSGTDFALAAYRYSTEGYAGMTEVLDTYTDGGSGYLNRRKSRFEVSMNQSLSPELGALNMSLYSEDYWGNGRKDQSVSVGYSNFWKDVSFSVDYSHTRSITQDEQESDVSTDNALSVSVSIPFDGFFSSYSYATSKSGSASHRVNLSGHALQDKNLSWSAQQGYTESGGGNDGSLNARYMSGAGEFAAGYTYNDSSTQINYSARGGVLLHGDGVTVGQYMGETPALVDAGGAAGVKVQGQSGVYTDSRGYAIVPYTTPYRKNSVGLSVEAAPEDVEMVDSVKDVVPTRGALTRAKFVSRIGRRALISLKNQLGFVPFGARVDIEGEPINPDNIVGNKGQIYLTGLQPTGVLKVSWGEGAGNSCKAKYELPEDKNGTGIVNTSAKCE